MPGTATSRSTSFDGKLIRRHHKPGQKYVQLIFETPKGAKISLSRNAQLVNSLEIGKKYRIEGTEIMLGSRPVISEPKATLLSRSAKLQKPAAIAFSIFATLVFVGGSAFAIVGSKHELQPSSGEHTKVTDQPQVKSDTITSVNQLEQNPSNNSTDATATDDSATAATTNQKKTTATAPTTSSTPTTSGATSNSGSPPAVGTTTYCTDPAVTNKFKSVTITDPNGHDDIKTYPYTFQTGIDEKSQTCYTDSAKTQNPKTVITTPERDEIIYTDPGTPSSTP